MPQRSNGPEACLRKALRAAEDAGLDADDLKVGVDVSGQLKQQVDVVRSSKIKLEEFPFDLGACQQSTTIKVCFKSQSVEMKFFSAWPHIAPSLQAAKLKLQELEEKEAAEDASDPQHEETDKPWRTAKRSLLVAFRSRTKTLDVDITSCPSP